MKKIQGRQTLNITKAIWNKSMANTHHTEKSLKHFHYNQNQAKADIFHHSSSMDN